MSWARVGSGSPSVCATSYLGIPQRGHGNAAVVAEGDTFMARIRGARGDAFRTGLPRLFKTLGRSGSRKPPVNPAALIESNPLRTAVRLVQSRQRLALTPGTRLGPYEVTAQIGVGSMGEVYRATDTNLKRSVAIKVLPTRTSLHV